MCEAKKVMFLVTRMRIIAKINFTAGRICSPESDVRSSEGDSRSSVGDLFLALQATVDYI